MSYSFGNRYQTSEILGVNNFRTHAPNPWKGGGGDKGGKGRSDAAENFQMREDHRVKYDEDTRVCLDMWAEYLRRAIRGEFPVHPSIKDSDFFDELLGFFGASRISFDRALKKAEANHINTLFIGHRKNLAKYGSSGIPHKVSGACGKAA